MSDEDFLSEHDFDFGDSAEAAEAEAMAMADAEVEDTVHCDFCGASWNISHHHDGVTVTDTRILRRDSRISPEGQIKLCHECAYFFHFTIEQWLAEDANCEHGVITGERCEECVAAHAIELNEKHDLD